LRGREDSFYAEEKGIQSFFQGRGKVQKGTGGRGGTEVRLVRLKRGEWGQKKREGLEKS